MSARAPEIAAQLADRAGGVWQSEGRRLFNIVRGTGPTATKLIVMAMQLGCVEQYVGELLHGRKQPSGELATRIFLVHGIPAHAWWMKPIASRDMSTAADEKAESAA